jgi:hypothetical protein
VATGFLISADIKLILPVLLYLAGSELRIASEERELTEISSGLCDVPDTMALFPRVTVKTIRPIAWVHIHSLAPARIVRRAVIEEPGSHDERKSSSIVQ